MGTEFEGNRYNGAFIKSESAPPAWRRVASEASAAAAKVAGTDRVDRHQHHQGLSSFIFYEHQGCFLLRLDAHHRPLQVHRRNRMHCQPHCRKELEDHHTVVIVLDLAMHGSALASKNAIGSGDLKGRLRGTDVFRNSFEAFKRGGKGLPPVPENLVKQWDTLYDAKDRLEKVHDYTMKCQNMEEEIRPPLVGPRPEWGHVADASKLMENSVSARINKVVRSSGDLSAACDKVLHLIGSPSEKGVGAEVHGVVKSLDDASRKLHDLTFGKQEEAVSQAASCFLPLEAAMTGRHGRRRHAVRSFL
eukprot:s1318_g12.t1